MPFASASVEARGDAGWDGRRLNRARRRASLRVDVVELGRADQGVDARRAQTTAVRTDEKSCLPSEGDTAQGTFGRLLVSQILPASRKRVKAGHRLSTAFHGSGDVGTAGELGRSLFIQTSSSPTRAAACSRRWASRSAAACPLIARSWAKIASIWRTASTASGAGGPCRRGRGRRARRIFAGHWRQHPPITAGSVAPVSSTGSTSTGCSERNGNGARIPR